MLLSHLGRLSHIIDAASEWSGKAISWLVLLMVLVIVYDVGMRYLFQIGSVTLQELEWHLFSLVFLLGAAYTFKHDGHVRVDIFYQSRFMNVKRRALVDIFGTVLFLIPFCLLIIISSTDFVANSYAIAEGSPDPGGLPYRFLLKASIPLGFILILVQGVSILVRNILVLAGPGNQPTSNESKES